MAKNQGHRVIKWLFATGSVLAIFLVLTGVASATYHDRVLPNTYLLGKNFAGAREAEVKRYFIENPPYVTGTVNFSLEDDTQNATPEELGVRVDVDKSIEKLFIQNRIWQTPIVTPRGLTSFLGQRVTLQPTFGMEGEVFENKLREMFKEKEREPVNATIAVENDEVVVRDEEPGYAVNTSEAQENLMPYLPGGRIPVIALTLKTVEAQVKAGDLESSKELLARQISGPISIANNYRVLATADLATIVGWLDQEALGNQQVKVKEEQMKDWLDKNIVKKVATASRPRLVSATDESVVIDPGRAGTTVDATKLARDVENAINTNPQERVIRLAVTTIEPETKKVAPGYTLGRYSGKYLEVDLSKQMLYQIEGDVLVGSRRVSTGKWSMPTPKGEYFINNKVGRAYSSRYNLFMPYWMAFIGSSYGIHELPEWSNGAKEGQSHLGTPVSHGCIRLGVGDAAAVYEWTDIGTPLIIH